MTSVLIALALGSIPSLGNSRDNFGKARVHRLFTTTVHATVGSRRFNESAPRRRDERGAKI